MAEQEPFDYLTESPAGVDPFQGGNWCNFNNIRNSCTTADGKTSVPIVKETVTTQDLFNKNRMPKRYYGWTYLDNAGVEHAIEENTPIHNDITGENVEIYKVGCKIINKKDGKIVVSDGFKNSRTNRQSFPQGVIHAVCPNRNDQSPSGSQDSKQAVKELINEYARGKEGKVAISKHPFHIGRMDAISIEGGSRDDKSSIAIDTEDHKTRSNGRNRYNHETQTIQDYELIGTVRAPNDDDIFNPFQLGKENLVRWSIPLLCTISKWHSILMPTANTLSMGNLLLGTFSNTF